MDISNLALLTNEQQIELKQYQELFDSAGYKLVIRKAREEISSIETAILNSVEDERGLYYFRGQRSKLLGIITLENNLESYYNGLVGDLEHTQEEIDDSFGANA